MTALNVVFRNFANAPNINGRKSWDIFQDKRTWTAARSQLLQSQKAQGKLSKREHSRGCANPGDQELEDRSAKQEPMKEHSGGGQSCNWPAVYRREEVSGKPQGPEKRYSALGVGSQQLFLPPDLRTVVVSKGWFTHHNVSCFSFIGSVFVNEMWLYRFLWIIIIWVSWWWDVESSIAWQAMRDLRWTK